MKVSRIAAAVVPVAALIAMGMAGPAHAGENCTDKSDDGGATATFKHDGEHLLVTDNFRDGHSAIGHLEMADHSGDHYWYWNRNGKGTTKDFNLPNIVDGVGVHIGAYLGNWQGTADGGIDFNSNNVIPYCGGVALK
ncbi:hypothetical protein [Streptomyces sp. NPDC020607]|uniref:hypothetical protein n=1 Tax=Streptomyces sp. NPDC020607 TaxID=3365082 RepID=UPI0037888D3D